MPYDLKEPVWNGNIDREEIRDADEDEQMSKISITCGRYYSVANGPDIEFYKKKLEEAKECLNLPDDLDKAGCEFRIGAHPDDEEEDIHERKFIWLRGNHDAFEVDHCDRPEWSYDFTSEYLLRVGFELGFGVSVPLEPSILEEIKRINIKSLDEINIESEDDDSDYDEIEIRRKNEIIKTLTSMEITPELRKKLREARVEFYKKWCEYYTDNDICSAPDNDGCSNIQNCCSYEKIDTCYCRFDKNRYACILTPCCRHKMHLRCLYAWKERKETACGGILGRAEDIAEHCPYCRANWADYGNGFYPPRY